MMVDSSAKIGKNILPIDFVLGDNDVLCGRGAACFNHEGNKRFRLIIAAKLEKYAKAYKKFDKTSIIYEVIDEVRRNSPNGGFVKKDLITRRYYEVGDFLAREKTSQAFREAMKDIYLVLQMQQSLKICHHLSMKTHQKSSLHKNKADPYSILMQHQTSDNTRPIEESKISLFMNQISQEKLSKLDNNIEQVLDNIDMILTGATNISKATFEYPTYNIPCTHSYQNQLEEDDHPDALPTVSEADLQNLPELDNLYNNEVFFGSTSIRNSYINNNLSTGYDSSVINDKIRLKYSTNQSCDNFHTISNRSLLTVNITQSSSETKSQRMNSDNISKRFVLSSFDENQQKERDEIDDERAFHLLFQYYESNCFCNPHNEIIKNLEPIPIL